MPGYPYYTEPTHDSGVRHTGISNAEQRMKVQAGTAGIQKIKRKKKKDKLRSLIKKIIKSSRV